MRRPLQLVPAAALLTSLLVAAGCVAMEEAVGNPLRELCRGQGDFVCSCSTQHPDMDVMYTNSMFLSNATGITIKDCSAVNLGANALELALKLQKLRVFNVSYLALQSVLPLGLKQLVLSRIGELSSAYYIVQVPMNMAALTMQNVTFKELEPGILEKLNITFTEITGCRFPNVSRDSLHIESRHVVVKGNTFASLDAGALMVRSENATISNNSFEALVNGSIQWQPWVQGVESKLSFESNTIRSLEVGALTELYRSEKSTVSDNVLLCRAEDYEHCKQQAASGVLPVCDAKDVCPYRDRSALTRALAEERGCRAGSPLSVEECAVLVVSGAAHLQAASSVAAAIALLAVILSAA